jgi:glycylpeptide N-tetradecanoyltransferase
MSPGWTKEWHVGVRASASRKLVAFISAVPMELRVRKKVLHASEVNFLCIHKKLRSKRLTPVLIKEITRRCYLLKTWQAIYTAGIVLPTPVSTTRYYHRSIDWQKLNDIGFSPLPPNSKPQYQVMKYKLPDHTSTKGLRPMEEKDLDAVLSLLQRYLAKFEMAPIFTREEFAHWMFHHKDSLAEQVVWSYVVEVRLFLLKHEIYNLLMNTGSFHLCNNRLLLLLLHRIYRHPLQTHQHPRGLRLLLRHGDRLAQPLPIVSHP